MSSSNAVIDNNDFTNSGKLRNVSLQEIQNAVNSGVNYRRCQDGMTYLHRLCHAGNLEGVIYLMNSDCDIDVNCKDVFQRTPLALAVSGGHMKVVEYLVSCTNKKVLIDHPNSCGETPLMNAARKCNSSIVDYLLKMNANVNSRNDQLDTSLHLICRYFEQINTEQIEESIFNVNECARLLVLSGARLDLQNSRGESVMHAIAKTQCKSFVQIILSNSSNEQLLEGFRTCDGLGNLVWQLSFLNKTIRRQLFSKYKTLILDTVQELGVENLNNQGVLDWLRTVFGMNYNYGKFIEFDLNGEDLMQLDDVELKHKFNIEDLHHRKVLLDTLSELKKSARKGAGEPGLFNRNINSNEINLTLEVLGIGFFGKVYKATWKQAVVAVKKIIRKKRDSSEYVKSVFREIEVISSLRHPNILEFYGYTCQTNGDISLVMEYMTNGSLKSALEKDHARIFSMKHQIARDVCLGMAHLHSCEFMHRDLNTKNLLLGRDYRVKIADFGLSRLKDMNLLMSKKIGFLGTMAPEVFNGEVYSEKADIFSFGVILYEILSGNEIYKEFLRSTPTKSLNSYAYSVANCNYRPSWPSDSPQISSEWKMLTESCWSSNPDDRPSFLQILEILNSFKDTFQNDEDLHRGDDKSSIKTEGYILPE